MPVPQMHTADLQHLLGRSTFRPRQPLPPIPLSPVLKEIEPPSYFPLGECAATANPTIGMPECPKLTRLSTEALNFVVQLPQESLGPAAQLGWFDERDKDVQFLTYRTVDPEHLVEVPICKKEGRNGQPRSAPKIVKDRPVNVLLVLVRRDQVLKYSKNTRRGTYEMTQWVKRPLK